MKRNPFSELTREVLEYQKTGRGNTKLVGKIAEIVYAYPRNYLGWDEDDVGDFFCMFFPKISRLVNRFTYTGRAFEAYLASSIRWQMKTFARKRKVYHAKQEMIRMECRGTYLSQANLGVGSAQECYAGEQTHTYSPNVSRLFGIGSDGVISDPAIGRRFVYLVLRNAVLADDSLIEHAAKLTKMDANHLLGCATELRQIIGRRKARYLAMAERRDGLYARIQQLTILLGRETDESRIRKYRRQIEFARDRYERILAELRSVSLLPTHKDIGDVLGIPKGSIDSGLYYIRKEIRNLELN